MKPYRCLVTSLAASSRPLPTAVVGSYPQPDWLIDHRRLAGLVPRIRMPELWRVPPDQLERAQDDATLEAIADMESAGIDVISDGEIRRESYSSAFATALDGIDGEHPATIRNRAGHEVAVPRVVGPVRRRGPVEVRNLEFLRRHTDRTVKVALPGPFTLAQQALDEHYGDIDELVMDLAAALADELRDLEAAGAQVIQLDEPWLRNDPPAAERLAVAAIDRALEGITVPTVVHLCFGYAAVVSDAKPPAYPFLEALADCAASAVSIEAAQPGLDLGVLAAFSDKTIMLGVIDLGDGEVESDKLVADRIRAGLRHVAADRLVPAPDCGMKYLSRDVARGKLRALAAGAALVRAELR
jgi:5-methyltetrahydropteroyltriglutamate--homocysteine methyltransferase